MISSRERAGRIFLGAAIGFGLASGICGDLGFDGTALWLAIFAFLACGGLANVASDAAPKERPDGKEVAEEIGKMRTALEIISKACPPNTLRSGGVDIGIIARSALRTNAGES